MRLVLITFILLSFFSCIESEKSLDFVKIENKHFYLNNEFYFPLGVNYIIELKETEEKMWHFPISHDEIKYEPLSTDSATSIIKADFQLIKDMGLNSIRLISIGHYLDHLSTNRVDLYIKALEELYLIAERLDLKLIILLPMSIEKDELLTKYQPVISHFKNWNTIMAYDFFNEPLYFDKVKKDRTKNEVFDISMRWEKYMAKNAPNQLSTIGLTGPRSVFEWDPNQLNVDFISFHPYEYTKNMVHRDIYWISQNVTKPWIIGETSYSADNDSILYSEQKRFAQKTLNQTINYGGAGLTWWQYKDVIWDVNDFHQNYMGLVNQEGFTQTSDKSLKVFGSKKETVDVFKKFKYKKEKMSKKPYNYYNIYEWSKFKIVGKIINKETKEPINNAVISGWDSSWNKTYITFSDQSGTFNLFGNIQYYHLLFSATNFTAVRKTHDWSTDTVSKGGISVVDIGIIEIEEVVNNQK